VPEVPEPAPRFIYRGPAGVGLSDSIALWLDVEVSLAGRGIAASGTQHQARRGNLADQVIAQWLI